MESLEVGASYAAHADLLRAYALEDLPGAWANLDRLFRLLLGEQFVQLAGSLMEQISRAASPDQALRNLSKFIAQSFNPFGFGARLLGSSDLLNFLVQIFGFSQFLSDILIRNPEYLDYLRAPDVLQRPKLLNHYRHEAAQALSVFEEAGRRRDALCRYQRKELLRIGVRDLFGMGTLTELTAELSDLAEAIVDLAAEEALDRLTRRHGKPYPENDPSAESRFGIVAMGKLGGRELNFSSDIDLIFFYSEEGRTTGINGERYVSNHDFFTRVGEDIISQLSRYDNEGFLYRVDVRLRPDGETGPLVRSLAGMETYYLTQARSWERLAMTKARVIYGSEKIAKSFQMLADHFVYGQPLGSDLLAELADLKSRIDDQVVQRGLAGRDVKRGVGGIREIEFIVGALQLLHGRTHRSLRIRPTLQSLALIGEKSLLDPEECKTLREAYIFLRNVEHRLQMISLAQTHTLPEKDKELRELALRCGLPASETQSPEEQFKSVYKTTTKAVHSIFTRLFGQGTSNDRRNGVLRAVDLALSPEERFEALKPYRFTDPSILGVFDALARGHKDFYLSAEGQQFFESILPRFLNECKEVPMPEQAVRMFDNFLLRLKGIASTYDFIAEQPLALRILLKIFGSSEFLGRIIQSHPEFLDTLLDGETLSQSPEAKSLKKQALRYARDRSGEDFQQALCRFRELESLAGGARWLEGIASTEAISHTLSDLADGCLEASLQMAANELAESESLDGPPTGLAVLAMGKLGIREMNFFSDLDLIFIQGDAPAGVKDAASFFARWAQRIVTLISGVSPAGFVFKIDARLRPEGRNAPLVAPLSRYLDYYQNRAQPWEFQSIIRCRHSAGDAALSEQLRSGILPSAIALGKQDHLATEVRNMRRRLEESVLLPSWARTDFKRSRGGVIDLEFLIQYLQLKGLGENSALFTSDFENALAGIVSSQLITSEQKERIESNYRYLRQLEMRARLLFSTGSSFLPDKKERLAPLEFFMRNDLPNGATLLQHTASIMNENHALFEEIVR